MSGFIIKGSCLADATNKHLDFQKTVTSTNLPDLYVPWMDLNSAQSIVGTEGLSG